MLTLLNADLSATFAPSAPVLVDGQRLMLELEIDVEEAVRIELRIEFSSGTLGKPASQWEWFPEASAVANGATLEQAPLVRVIPGASATLPPGVHGLTIDPGRVRAPLARVQARTATGSAHLRVNSAYGLAVPVSTPAEQSELLERIDGCLDALESHRRGRQRSGRRRREW